MSLAADAVQAQFIPGLTGLEGRASGETLADLIGGQKTIGFDLDFDDDNKLIVADFRDPAPVLGSMASDIFRFASAAFQTIGPLSTTMSESEHISWSLVRAYYAAFYAAHAITRMLGESCSFFERGHIQRLTALAAAFGNTPGFVLISSSYRCTLSASTACISSKSLRGGTGGAHEAFWNVFGQRLSRLGEEVLTSPLGQADAQAVFAKVEALRQCLSLYNAPLHSWLSIVRNQVQYRHTHGVWMPCKVRRQDRDRLARLIGQWMRDPMEIDIGAVQAGQLGEFVVTCAFVVSLCHALLVRIAERSPRRGRSFATLGPLAVLRG